MGALSGPRPLLTAIAAMCAVVVASNILVQFPVHGRIGAVVLADLLTYGAFTYPLAFLVTDLTNRRFGPRAARLVVVAGFALAVVLSWIAASPRIAIASGSAFVVAQLLDVAVFDRLRRGTWWRAPLISSLIGSLVDTALFFSIAFSAGFGFLGPNDAFALAPAGFLGVFAVETPRWISWAAGDLAVKLIVAVALLGPYRALMRVIRPRPAAAEA